MNQEIKSPCIRICKMDNSTGLCTGCYRTIDEIADWVFLSDEEKLKLLAEIEKRKEKMNRNKHDTASQFNTD